MSRVSRAISRLFLAVILFVPLPALAQARVGSDLEEIIGFVYRVVSHYLIPIAFSLALFFFIWGLALFIKDSGDSAKHEEGRNKMIWGVLALFVIVAVWGLVRFLGNVFGIRNTGPLAPPGVPGESQTRSGLYDNGNFRR